MPPRVEVLSSDGKVNVSDEVWSSYEDDGTVVRASAVEGVLRPKSPDGGRTSVIAPPTAPEATLNVLGANGGSIVFLRPSARVRRRRPQTVSVKEELSPDELTQMLDDPADWKLSVSVSADAAEVLDKRKLQEAADADASRLARVKLRQPNPDERAVLDAVAESLTPKSGVAAVKGALGAPVANVALVVSAAAAFGALGAAGKEVVSPWSIAALVLVAGAMVLSFVGTHVTRSRRVRLSRLDLLEQEPLGVGQGRAANFAAVLFAAGLLFSAVAFVVALSGSDEASATFGPASTTSSGNTTTLSFTVTWEDLSDDGAQIETTVRAPGRPPQVLIAQKEAGGGATHDVRVEVSPPAQVDVTSRVLGADGRQIGDGATHEYAVH